MRAARLAGLCRGVMGGPADAVLIEGAGGWRVPLNRRETLADVASKFGDTDFDEFPVVSDDDEKELLGIISRRQLNNAYIKRTMHYDQVAKAENQRPVHSGRFEGVKN